MAFIRSESHFQTGDTVYLKEAYKITTGTFTKGHPFLVTGFQAGSQMDDTDYLKVKSAESDMFTNGIVYTIDKKLFTRNKPPTISSSYYDR